METLEPLLAKLGNWWSRTFTREGFMTAPPLGIFKSRDDLEYADFEDFEPDEKKFNLLEWPWFYVGIGVLGAGVIGTIVGVTMSKRNKADDVPQITAQSSQGTTIQTTSRSIVNEQPRQSNELVESISTLVGVLQNWKNGPSVTPLHMQQQRSSSAPIFRSNSNSYMNNNNTPPSSNSGFRSSTNTDVVNVGSCVHCKEN